MGSYYINKKKDSKKSPFFYLEMVTLPSKTIKYCFERGKNPCILNIVQKSLYWVRRPHRLCILKKTAGAVLLLIIGDGGSRTHVQKYFRRTFSERSQCFVIRRIRRDADTLRNCYPVSPLKYQELSQRFPAFMTPDFKPAGEPEAARGAELCSQCEIVVIFSVYI